MFRKNDVQRARSALHGAKNPTTLFSVCTSRLIIETCLCKPTKPSRLLSTNCDRGDPKFSAPTYLGHGRVVSRTTKLNVSNGGKLASAAGLREQHLQRDQGRLGTQRQVVQEVKRYAERAHENTFFEKKRMKANQQNQSDSGSNRPTTHTWPPTQPHEKQEWGHPPQDPRGASTERGANERAPLQANIDPHLNNHAIRTRDCMARGALRALALANCLRNSRLSSNRPPPTSLASTTRCARP